VKEDKKQTENATHRTVVPNRDAVLLPLEADLEVVVFMHDAREVLEDDVRLVLGNTNDATREIRVHIQPTPTGHRVRANDFEELSERGRDKSMTTTYSDESRSDLRRRSQVHPSQPCVSCFPAPRRYRRTSSRRALR